MTNFEWWREKTDTPEGAADNSLSCWCCVHRDDDCVRERYVCHDGILLWLKQEVDNDES